MISRVAVACASLSDGAELSAHEKLKAIDGDDEQTEQRIQGPGLLDCSVSVSSVQPYVRTQARADKTEKKKLRELAVLCSSDLERRTVKHMQELDYVQSSSC